MIESEGCYTESFSAISSTCNMNFCSVRYSGHHSSNSHNSIYFSRLSEVAASDDDSNRHIKHTATETISQLPKVLKRRSPSIPVYLEHLQHLNIVYRTSPSLSPTCDLNRLACETRHFVASIHTAPFNDDDENMMEKAVTSLKERKQKKVGYCGWQ